MFRSAFLTLVATCMALPLTAGTSTRTLTEEIPAQGLVKIENLAGKVVLRSTPGDSIKVRAEVHAEGGSSAETERLLDAVRIAREGGAWVLTYPVDRYDAFVYPQSGWGGNSSTKYRGERVRVSGKSWRSAPVLYVNLMIEVPRNGRLHVRNLVGDIAGESLAGELTADTGSGDVWLKDFDGQLVADTGSGTVTLQGVRGTSLRVDTGSGDVRAEDVHVERLEADTGSGEVWIANVSARWIEADTGSGDITLEDLEAERVLADTGSGDVLLTGDLSGAREIVADTGSGDIRILAGAGFEFDLDADLGSGRVRVGYSDAELVRHGREVVGARRGSGATRISVDTGSGNCEVGPN
jgi:hypothetical protein